MKASFLIIGFLTSCSYIQAQNWHPVAEVIEDVHSLFYDSLDNSLYIGGRFFWFDSLEARGIVRWDGQTFHQLGFFPNAIWGIPPSSTDAVASIIRYKDEIYCTLINGPWSPGQIRGLARWDGISWDSIGGIDGIVFNQIIYKDELYIMGRFRMAESDTVAMIIKWDGENWHDTGFFRWLDESSVIVPQLALGTVNRAVIFNGELYVCGNFYNEDFSVQDVAKFDGKNWYPMPPIKGAWDDPIDMIVYKGELYISGDFKKSAGNAGNKIMKLKNGQWVDVGGSFDNYLGGIGKMRIYYDKLYVFGSFNTMAGGVQVTDIAVWDGERWCGLGSNFNKVIIDAVMYEGDIIVGGAFEYIDSVQIYSLARWTGGDYLESCGEAVATSAPPYDLNKLSISPNPAQSLLNISAHLPAQTSSILTARNLLGQSLWQETLPSASSDIQTTVDVSAWSPGVYFISLEAGGQVWVEKVVVQ